MQRLSSKILWCLFLTSTLVQAQEGGFSEFKKKEKSANEASTKVDDAAAAEKAEAKIDASVERERRRIAREERKRKSKSQDDAKAHSAPNAAAKGNEAELVLTTSVGCFVVQFSAPVSSVMSCTQPFPIKYTKRECASGKAEEAGNVEAIATCEDSGRLTLRFRTSQDAIAANMQIFRTQQGPAGVVTRYAVQSAAKDQSAFAKLLPEAELIETEPSSTEESPLKFKASGFAWVEMERTSKFGYDTPASGSGQSTQQNFTSSGPQPTQANTSFFSNVGLEVGKDRTNLVSLFEVGEVYFGDDASGGLQGTRKGNIFEIRNAFIEHDLGGHWSTRLGLVTTGSDPRSFIFNDHIASIQFLRKTDLSNAHIWYGNARQNRPAATGAQDSYIGMSGTMGLFSGIKGTAFALYRSAAVQSWGVADSSGTITTETADLTSYWLGGTFDYEFGVPVGMQITLIGNSNTAAAGTKKEGTVAYLADLKLNYSASSFFGLSLEGVFTSGSNDGNDPATGNPIVGKSKSYNSPVGVSYLLTIATSDGADDAPGTPKQSTIASLGQAEGLRIAVLSANFNFNRRTSGLLRYGYLTTSADSATTRSSQLGQEVDLQLVYQATPSFSVQLDYATFMPGSYFSNKDAADLVAMKTKFSF